MKRFHLMLATVGSLALLSGSAADAVAFHGGFGYGGYDRGGYGYGGCRSYDRGGYGYGNYGYRNSFYGGFGSRGYCGPSRSFRGPVGRFQPQERPPQPGLNRTFNRPDGPKSPQAPGNRNLAPPVPGRAPVGSDQKRNPAPMPITIPEKMKGIGLLPKADQAAALAQNTCPVTKGLLGSHGKPIKVLVKGQAIFVCCQGCVEDVTANPQEFLKKQP